MSIKVRSLIRVNKDEIYQYLTKRYIFAIILMGVLLVTSYLIFTLYFRTLVMDGYYINISGRQRMLSQRIALLATTLDFKSNPNEVFIIQDELNKSIELMTQTHDELSKNVNLNPNLSDIYFGDQYALNKTVHEFLDTFKIANRTRAYYPIEKLNFLLAGLDRVVSELQAETIQHDYNAILIQTILLVLEIIVLILIVIFIFKPMTIEITDKTEKLNIEREHINLLLDISVIANESRAVNDAIIKSLTRICVHTGWSVGHSYTLDKKNSYLLLPTKLWYLKNDNYFKDFVDITEKTPLKIGAGLPGRVLQSGEPIWVVDVLKDQNFPRNKTACNLGVRSAFAFPILVQGEIVSVLEFFSEKIINKDDLLLNIVSHVGKQLGQVYEREKYEIDIRQVNQSLENRVVERTKEIKALQEDAVINAHRAGMAEIVTGVIHNIGNILNSLYVGVETILIIIENSKCTKLTMANELLVKNLNHLADFFAKDPQGKILPEYYLHLGEEINSEFAQLKKEMLEIQKRIQLIRDVISSQQVYAKGGQFKEEVIITDVIEDALKMQFDTSSHLDVKVIKKYFPVNPIVVQKASLTHILLNLFKNANESMKILQNDQKILTIETGSSGHNIFVKISDTGGGIAKENLNKIFNHGFTTKQSGHGFGLHSCANAMTTMGGKISVTSEGLMKGATFILEFPEKNG